MGQKFQAVDRVVCNPDPKKPDQMICRFFRPHQRYPTGVGHIRKVSATNVDVRVSNMLKSGEQIRTIIKPQKGQGLLTVEVDTDHKFMTVKG